MSKPTLEEIIHFMPLSGNIGTAGQPTAAQYQAIKEAGYEKVINLAMGKPTAEMPDERATAATWGLAYIHIPVVWEAPTHQNLADFFAVMEANKDHKLFVHCNVNYRVSTFMFLYRVLREGVDPKIAARSMHLIWYPSREPGGVWQKFIDDELQICS